MQPVGDGISFKYKFDLCCFGKPSVRIGKKGGLHSVRLESKARLNAFFPAIYADAMILAACGVERAYESCHRIAIFRVEHGALMQRSNLKPVEPSSEFVSGVQTHDSILHFLNLELARAQREGTTVGIFLAELQAIDGPNQRGGDSSAQNLLAETAQRLRASLRIYDGLGRWGEAKFLIVMPCCGIAAAKCRAEILREKIESW